LAVTESLPPQQVVIPTTHYVPVETDRFAYADSIAMEEYARKYPGSRGTLTAFQGMRKQFYDAQKAG